MPPNEPILLRLHLWLVEGANSERLCKEDLDDAFSFEDGIFQVSAPLAADHTLGFPGECWVDVSLVAEVSHPDSFVGVLRGRDRVTNLWHQCAWVFLLRGEKIVRAITTVSAPLERRPYDGTLPLREAP